MLHMREREIERERERLWMTDADIREKRMGAVFSPHGKLL